MASLPAVFKSDVLFFQRLMKSIGYYPHELDGDWGSKTQEAADKFIKESDRIIAQYGTFDPRSEACILTLLPKAQEAARSFLIAAKPFKYQVKILSGTRTYAEQNKLFNQRPVVTRARGGQSNHNFGIAFDVGIFDGGKYFTGATRAEEQAYIDLRALTKRTGPKLDWGGDWKSIIDRPHYELHTGKSTSQVRALLESGTAYV